MAGGRGRHPAAFSHSPDASLHRVAVYDRNMRLAGVVEEEELLRAALEDANAPVGGLL